MNYNIVLTAETEDFDPDTEQLWRDEGFMIKYVPLLDGGNKYIQRVHNAGDSFGVGEYYGIVGGTPLVYPRYCCAYKDKRSFSDGAHADEHSSALQPSATPPP